MNITFTEQDLFIYLLCLWAVGATIVAWQYRSLAYELKRVVRESLNLACNITKDEALRKDFEVNVVDKLIAARKERN